MPRALQKLVRNGNSTAVSLPKAFINHLGWLPGESMLLEILEDKSIRIRRPTERDFVPAGPPRLFHDAPETVKV